MLFCFSSRRRHTRSKRDWSSDVCSSDLTIQQAIRDGYKRVKLKIKPGHDLHVLEKDRKHFPELPIMVDANSAYTLKDIELLRRLDAYNLLMIEQPLAHDDIIDHAILQQAIKTPICLA